MTTFIKTSLLVISLAATSNVAFANNAVGKKTYDQVCSACHANGMSGAPIFGNLNQWAPRRSKGKGALYVSALNGRGAMPARGGQSSLSDATVKAAVDYMLANSSSK